MKKIKVGISIVNWNTANQLDKCLKSIEKYSEGIAHKVFVVDNDSEDNSVKLVKEKYPNVSLIENKKNLGFGKANNQALKKLKSDFVFILNPDIEFTRDTLQILVNFMDNNPEVSVCSPLLLNDDKTIQKKGYFHKLPSVSQTILFYTDLYKICIKLNFLRDKFWESQIKPSEIFEVEQIPGACLFARSDVLRGINFFDERFELLFEDVDLCYRLKQKGYKLIVVPQSKVIHEGGASFKKLNDAIAQTRFFKGLFLFFDLHHNLLERILVRFIIFCELIYLILLVSFKSIFKPSRDKPVFIKNKWIVIKNLLVS